MKIWRRIRTRFRIAHSDPPQEYDVLALDAFSGDGIPFHLMTREVMTTYLRHLKSDGLLAFHIGNRRLDLAPVVEGLARYYRLHTLFFNDKESTWALAAREPASLDAVSAYASPGLVPRNTRLWTDDHAREPVARAEMAKSVLSAEPCVAHAPAAGSGAVACQPRARNGHFPGKCCNSRAAATTIGQRPGLGLPGK